MAATDRGSARALMAAALALPGIAPTAVAQTMPDEGVLSLRYLDYRDWQPGANRMHVQSPSLYVMKPFGGSWVAEGSLVYDAMSGASPRYYNTLSGASVTDYRTAGDAKVTRYFDRYAIGVSGVVSSERDFLSRGGGFDVRWWTEDRNTTLAFGFAGTDDTINPVNEIVVDAKRYTLDFLFGVTQAVNANAIVQSNLTWSQGTATTTIRTRRSTRGPTAGASSRGSRAGTRRSRPPTGRSGSRSACSATRSARTR